MEPMRWFAFLILPEPFFLVLLPVSAYSRDFLSCIRADCCVVFIEGFCWTLVPSFFPRAGSRRFHRFLLSHKFDHFKTFRFFKSNLVQTIPLIPFLFVACFFFRNSLFCLSLFPPLIGEIRCCQPFIFDNLAPCPPRSPVFITTPSSPNGPMKKDGHRYPTTPYPLF